MADRPYQKLTGGELSRVLSEALEKGRRPSPGPLDITAFGDPHKTWLVGVDPGVGSSQSVETVFRVGADGKPEAVTRLVDKPSQGAVRNVTETEFNWLRHRVDEVIAWGAVGG